VRLRASQTIDGHCAGHAAQRDEDLTLARTIKRDPTKTAESEPRLIR
jgi:hypothetical protein